MGDDKATRSYQVEKSATFEGRWAVVDRFTGWPVFIRGIPLDALPGHEVGDLVDELRWAGLEGQTAA